MVEISDCNYRSAVITISVHEMCHISASHASRIVKLIFMMAGNSDSGRNNRIIGELLDRVEQLSEAISTRANSEVNEEVLW